MGVPPTVQPRDANCGQPKKRRGSAEVCRPKSAVKLAVKQPPEHASRRRRNQSCGELPNADRASTRNYRRCSPAAAPALPSQARCPLSAPPMLPSDAAEPKPPQVAVSATVSNLPSCHHAAAPALPSPARCPLSAPPLLPSMLPNPYRRTRRLCCGLPLCSRPVPRPRRVARWCAAVAAAHY